MHRRRPPKVLLVLFLLPLLLLLSFVSTSSSSSTGGGSSSSISSSNVPRRPPEFAVELEGWEMDDVDRLHERAKQLAMDHSLELVGPVGELTGVYLYRGELLDLSADTTIESEARVAAKYHRIGRRMFSTSPGVRWAEYQKPLRRQKRSAVKYTVGVPFGDPLFEKQWHLNNFGDSAGINVTGVWEQDITGKGVVVSLLDDGLDYLHPDLAENFCTEGSYDFNFDKPDPMPSLRDDIHGTRCAGEIAAVPNNNVCGVGVAYGSRISGERILSGDVTDSLEARAINYRWDINDIYSNSWGPWDNGETVEGPGPLCQRAILEGIKQGRRGKGSIFVFASGNGGPDDNCNFDGYTNSVFTISIGAIDKNDAMPTYVEPCVAQLAVTYSSNAQNMISTTDSHNRCTTRHGGTSAAAPLAAGMFALALQVRPDLTWRDMQWVIVKSAVKFNEVDRGWSSNAAGNQYSTKFGYGKLDAWRMVEVAKTWKLVGPHIIVYAPPVSVNMEIPYGEDGLLIECDVSAELVSPIRRLEHVAVTVNIDHSFRGDVEVILISPSGTESRLCTRRLRDRSRDGFRDWTFVSVQFWEENPAGKWILIVQDKTHEEFGGTLKDWRLTFYGEAVEKPTASPLEADLRLSRSLNHSMSSTRRNITVQERVEMADPQRVILDHMVTGIIVLFIAFGTMTIVFSHLWRRPHGRLSSKHASEALADMAEI